MAVTHYLEFSGGLQNRSSRFLQKPNELSILLNGYTDEVGALIKRPGFKKVGGTFESGNSVYVGNGGTYLYGMSNDTADTAGQLKYNNSATNPVGGTWTAVTGGTAIAANIKPVFVPFAEIKSLIIAGSTAAPTTQANYMVTLVSTYAAPGTTANVSLAPRSKWAIRFRDRIYHGNVAKNSNWSTGNWYNETVETKPNRIIHSNVPAAGALTYEDQGLSGYVNFLDMDGDNTGLGVNNDQLLAFTNSSMWTRSGDSTLIWKRKYSVGCDSGWTIQNMDIYTLWYNRNGIYAYSGGKPEKISNKIQPIIDSIADPSATFAACPDDDHYRLWVGTLTIGGRSFKNCLIQYTLSTNSFAIYSYRVPTTANDTWTSFGIFHDGTRMRMYAGTSSGQVHVLSEPGDATLVYADGNQTNETADITFWARTAKLDHGLPHELKQTSSITVYSERAQNAIVNAIGDPVIGDGEPRSLGQIHKQVQQFTVDPPNAYWHEYEFTETSQRPSLKINGFTINNQASSNFIPTQG